MAVRREHFFSVHILDNFDAKPCCALGQYLLGGQTYPNGTHINLVEETSQVCSLKEMYDAFKIFIPIDSYFLWSSYQDH